MHWTRRRLLQQGSLASAGLLASRAWAKSAGTGASARHMQRMTALPSAKTLDAMKLASFVDLLPLPVQQSPQGLRSSAELGAKQAPYYAIHAREIRDKLHRDLPPARLFGYGATSAPVLFEARSEAGILIDWINDLPAQHFLPLDTPHPGMEHAPPTRISTHMHGARVPSISDGYPDNWYGPGKSRLCYYPNLQDPTALWCHDHAMGVNRFNIFAGLMGWYLLRDDVEQSLRLPSGKYELPLLIYDRSFTPQGQLYYPNPPDEGAWSQEFLGDAMVVNGKVRPYHQVEPRKYRLRIANTANSRFFTLSLSNGQTFHVIGADQGLLAAAVECSKVVLAPAERIDLIVDFSASRGEHIILQSGEFDLMKFRVDRSRVVDDSQLPSTLRPVHRISESEAIRTRMMTLNEFDDDKGMAMVMLLNRKHWASPVTEIMKLGTTEIWSLANLTQDTHPIHLHMVRFQILDRRSFSADDYLATNTLPLRYTGPAMPPEPHEMGWKDVVQCPPGTLTRIIVPFQPYAGRYLWHCHILEHEANDMMRPYDIVA
ncbi:MAG TPA: multicopper oxidase domain-containing protein [Acidobacteriaceae bacterium]|nr:multicopper oxidase domain-containing protein [Acidobacteriaceae bacterium]